MQAARRRKRPVGIIVVQQSRRIQPGGPNFTQRGLTHHPASRVGGAIPPICAGLQVKPRALPGLRFSPKRQPQSQILIAPTAASAGKFNGCLAAKICAPRPMFATLCTACVTSPMSGSACRFAAGKAAAMAARLNPFEPINRLRASGKSWATSGRCSTWRTVWGKPPKYRADAKYLALLLLCRSEPP